MAPADILRSLSAARPNGHPTGIVSVCSSHSLVIEAALAEARDAGTVALIEATCNQVNQDGGYTGLTPGMFRDRVLEIAGRLGLAQDRIILGGDHLGPNPWRSLPARDAMQRAGEMVRAYVEAGFEKIHLDCSMGCADDPLRLSDAIIADRAAKLCAIAEHASQRAGTSPVYVVGTEVPTPGGAGEFEDELTVTDPVAVRETMRLHFDAFERAGVASAIARIIAVVVQPGVEFGSSSIHFYDRNAASRLTPVLEEFPGLVFEAHSTDYQRPSGLAALVEDGFAILKVGPWLTFAMREAFYGLDAVRQIRHPDAPSLPATMEGLMMAKPKSWRGHYQGDDTGLRLARHFSLSDRIRYYWDVPAARKAVDELLSGDAVDLTLISQYLPRIYDQARDDLIGRDPRTLVIAHIRGVLADYDRAVA